jgi:streptogramin lyase
MKAFYIHRAGKVALLTLALVVVAGGLTASAAVGNPGVYTLDADFDQGTLVNVNHNAPNNDQLQLDSEATPFAFIWIAISGRGTIVKVDTVTGTILGEYQSAPDGMGRDPSRTTVDSNGNVWAGNRAEASGGRGSAVHIGLKENGQCVDRNGNNVIDTSTGLSDVKPWTNTGSADTNGGVATAQDECIIHYVRTAGTNVRTVAVDGSNNVWIGGLTNRVHELLTANGAPVPGTLFNLGCGGYGGLVDRSGILWSSSGPTFSSTSTRLLRYDPSTSSGQWLDYGRYGYGLGIDTNGFIWHTNWTLNSVMKISPAGALAGTYGTGGASDDRGVVVTRADNNVWVANSGGNNVSRLDNNGTVLNVITVGTTPMGVAVDAAGKVWVTNYYTHNAMRIDPATDSVDLTVSLGSGAYPYNYSDMTGSTLIAPPNTGTWTIDHDSGIADAIWGFVTWHASTPSDSSLQVYAASSTDGVTFSAEEAVTNGVDLTVPDGQYLRVRVQFNRATTGESPILYDLTTLADRPPDCSAAGPSITTLWPPNHQWQPVTVNGVTDPDGDTVVITFTSIRQDEPVNSNGDGSFTPDGKGVGTSTAELRAERASPKKVPGNGRVYTLTFTATDPYGLMCEGTVRVNVPHNMGQPSIDDGPNYDSTALAP